MLSWLYLGVKNMKIEKISKEDFELNKETGSMDSLYLPFIFYNHGWEIDILDPVQMGLAAAVQVQKDNERYICYGITKYEDMLDYLKDKKRIPTGNVKKLVKDGKIEEMYRNNVSEIEIVIDKDENENDYKRNSL